MAHLPPGILTRYGPLIREPFGRVHWAGTETSTTSHGAIDGAVRSGERAAARDPRSPVALNIRGVSGEGGAELVLVGGPPATAPIEAFHAAHVVPHLDEVRITGLDVAPDELAPAIVPARASTSCRRSGAARGRTRRRPIATAPSGPPAPNRAEARADLVVDGNAHPRHLGDVVHGPPRGGEVEVDETHRYPSRNTTFSRHTSLWQTSSAAVGIDHLGAPRRTGRVDRAGRLVEPAHQHRDRRQRVISLGPPRVGRHRHLTLDEDQLLAAIGIDPDRLRSTVESGTPQRSQESVDRRSLRIRRAGARAHRHRVTAPAFATPPASPSSSTGPVCHRGPRPYRRCTSVR